MYYEINKFLIVIMTLSVALACKKQHSLENYRAQDLKPQDSSIIHHPLSSYTLKQLNSTPLYLLQKIVAQHSEQQQQLNTKISQLESINLALCNKISQQHQQCPILLSTQYDDQSISSCDAITTKPYNLVANLKTTSRSSFVITANDSISSTPFSAGKHSIKLITTGTPNQTMPAFKQIYQMYVKTVDNSAIEKYKPQDFQLTLTLNGVPLVNNWKLPHNNTLFNNQKPTALRATLIDLENLSISKKCIISSDDINHIKKTALAQHSSQNKDIISHYSNERKSVISQIMLLEKKIKQQTISQLQQSDRESQLQNYLTQAAQVSCKLLEPIKSLKVTLQGSTLSPKSLANTSSPLINTSGSCSSIFLSLGADLNFTIDNNEQRIIGGTWMPDRPPPNTIVRSFKWIKIKKMGFCFTSNFYNPATGWFGLKHTVVYQNYENNIFQITGINIIINDLLAYSQNNLNIIFEAQIGKKTLDTYFISNIYNNPSFIKLVGRTDCNAVQ